MLVIVLEIFVMKYACVHFDCVANYFLGMNLTCVKTCRLALGVLTAVYEMEYSDSFSVLVHETVLVFISFKAPCTKIDGRVYHFMKKCKCLACFYKLSHMNLCTARKFLRCWIYTDNILHFLSWKSGWCRSVLLHKWNDTVWVL